MRGYLNCYEFWSGSECRQLQAVATRSDICIFVFKCFGLFISTITATKHHGDDILRFSFGLRHFEATCTNRTTFLSERRSC